MRTAVSMLIGLAALVGAAEQASAQVAPCTIRGNRYFPAQNDSVTHDMIVPRTGSCIRNFQTRQMTFTGTQLVSPPSAGTVQVTGPSNLRYTARAGTRSDRFVVRVCARGQSGSGCSTITHVVTVQQ
ncbi:MAG: hypothetical protein LCH88_11600 [Proteobacteria bacterium]|nr:hypothetical protein [Pseudomonadota bacterium]